MSQERLSQSEDVGSVARGAWYGLLTQAVDKVLPVVLVLYLARTLAREQFGVYSFLIAYLAFFQIVSDYSIDTVLVRTMSEPGARRDALLQSGMGLKLSMATISATTAVAMVGVASGGQTPRGLTMVAALSLLTTLGGAYRAYFRSQLRIRNVCLQAGFRASLLAAGVVTAVALGADLRAIFAAMAIANLLTVATVGTLFRKEVTPRPAFERALWAKLIRGAAPLVLNALAMTISLRIGQVLLMSMRGPIEVGLMGAASRVTEAFTLLPDALMISIYPVMAAQAASRSRTLERTVRRSARYLTVAAGIPVVLSVAAGTTVMRILFGEPFAAAGPVLSMLAFAALLSATGTVILNLLVATHRERALSRNTVVFAAANVGLSILLIRHYGELGAAVAMVATSAASQVSLALLPATREYVRPVLAAAVPAVGSVLVAVAAVRVAGLHGLAAGGTGLFVYLVALYCAGALSSDEIRFLRSVLASLTGKGEAQAVDEQEDQN